jgi:amino acid transporter
MLLVVILANVVGSTRVFGEIEFWAASIKVLTIVGLIIVSIVITTGGGPTGEPIGFRYWHETGGFVQYAGIPGAWGRFLGFFAVLISAAFAFIGTEITAVAAAEAGSPGRTVPRAIRSVWVRLALFYIASAFLIGLLVSPSNPDLNLGSTAAKSPFVIAIKEAGIRVLPSVINAALLTSAWSAGIADLYISSRTLYGLYTRGATPRFADRWLGRTRKDGLPWVCVTICALFTPLAYFAASPSRSAGQAFGYFASMCAVCGMLSWSVILLTSIRWHYGLRARGIDRATLPYTAPLQPYLSYYGLAVSSVVIVFSGFTAFIHKFDTSAFITTYFGIPFFAVLLVGYKLCRKSGLVRYEDMDFVTGFSGTDDTDGERRGWLAKLSV